ncbi:MAG: LON peptidase substrate-binding domain-containing protein [Gammaproteobacteria bacterium]
MGQLTLPLFPLKTVLFPGGLLPLRVFEPRYLEMVCECLTRDAPFGICLIRSGSEVGKAAETFPVGTMARISDWGRGPDGLLAVTARGEQRFRIHSVRVGSTQLVTARVSVLPVEPEEFVPPHLRRLPDLLERIMEQAGPPYAELPRYPEDATWVGGRLAELLPLPLREKQELLELTDPLERLERLYERLPGLIR